ncbi:hypothetical protein D3C77_438340 [compost metagenome]
MADNKMRNFLLSNEALEVFSMLYHKGSQEDEDLPSKAGMADLITAGLAKKDPQDPNRNMLTKLGNHEAGVYYTELAIRKQQEQAQVNEVPAAEDESFEDGEPLNEAEPA